MRCRTLLTTLSLLSALLPTGGQVVEPRIDSISLVNATTGEPISGFDPIREGAVIDSYQLPNIPLEIQANTTPKTDFGSVTFSLSGATTYHATETRPPWSLFGSRRKKDLGNNFKNGAHKLTVQPFREFKKKRFQAGPKYTIHFTLYLPKQVTNGEYAANDIPISVPSLDLQRLAKEKTPAHRPSAKPWLIGAGILLYTTIAYALSRRK